MQEVILNTVQNELMQVQMETLFFSHVFHILENHHRWVAASVRCSCTWQGDGVLQKKYQFVFQNACQNNVNQTNVFPSNPKLWCAAQRLNVGVVDATSSRPEFESFHIQHMCLKLGKTWLPHESLHSYPTDQH